MHDEHKLKIFTCKASREFAQKVAKALKLEIGNSDVLTFSDGEFQPSYNESVRGATVFIIQSTFPPTDNLFELLLMIDAAKRASAHKVIAVMPYYGWARQDRQTESFNRCQTCCKHAAGCRLRPCNDMRPSCRPDPGFL